MITALSSLYKLAASGLSANQAYLDVVSNNIANATTPGFKSSHAVFSEALDNAAAKWEEITDKYDRETQKELYIGSL